MADLIQPRTLKGFRDYLPELMIPREHLLEQARHVYRSYGYAPIDTPALEYLEILRGKGFAQPNPRPMFPNPPGLLRLEPHSEGLRKRIWCGAATNATAVWAAKLGMNLQSSTLKFDETGEPFHVQHGFRRPTAP